MRPGRHIFLFIGRMGLMGWISRMRPGRHIFLFISRMGLMGWISRMRPGRQRHSKLPLFVERMEWGCPLSTTYFIILFFLSFLKKEDERL